MNQSQRETARANDIPSRNLRERQLLLKTHNLQHLPKQATVFFEPEIPFLAGPIPLQFLINLLLFLFRSFLPVA